MNSYPENILFSIISLIKEKKGIDFFQYKINTILRRLRQRISVLELDSFEEYYKYLKNNENEIEIITNYFLINTSEFFRDPLYFYYFENIVKKLINTGVRYIKILSIGSSSGEEPYTCAMILNEKKKKNPEFDYHIDAVDVDKEAIEEALKGEYLECVIQNIPYYYLKKYFIKTDSGWKLITDKFKENIYFYSQDILKSDFFFRGSFKYDFIFIRNVLLYFKEDQTEILFKKVLNVLDENGYILLGTSENLPHKYENYFYQLCKGIKIFKLKR